MRSEHPYTDSIYDRPPPPPPAGLANLSSHPPPHPPHPHPHLPHLAARNSVPKRANSTRSKTPTAALSGPTGPPPKQLPLIRANLAPQPSPLQSRDPNQHVLSLTSTTRSTTKNTLTTSITSITPITPIMPPGERPRQPQLSAAAAKALSRTPLTPKVAVVGTPLGRKTPTATAAREDAYAAAAPYLNNNVTPRSGPRQSRVNSTGTTPTGTPNPERMNDTWDGSGRGGLAMSPFAIGEGVGSRHSLGDESKNESKFFYASDAKPVHQPAPPRPASVVHQKNMPTFFYASDASAPSKRMMSPPMHPASTPTLGPTQEGVASKFFYANGTPDVDSSRVSLPSSTSGSASSSGSKTMARPGTSHSTAGFGTPMFSRPASPVKPILHSTTPQPPLRSSAMSPTSPRAQPYSPPMLAPTTNPASKRRISIDAPPRVLKGHARAGSVPTMESITGPKFGMPTANSPEPTSPPSSPGLVQPAMTMASILQIADELEEDDEDDDEEDEEEEEEEEDDDSQSESHSRRKSADPVNELVANARRERKVQDLEITNASLEAINRTLERQLRKQTAELRRYRRLSRSGRLAGASAASSRVPSVAITEPPADLSDLSEEDSALHEEEEDEDEDEDLDSLDESESSGEEPAADTQPPNTQSPSSKRRKRDERRLHLDLTKHQELLLDSQKMNQSLKRCLNWTEELIKEGQKALAYRVKVSEVELFGGRVLAPSYYDYDDDASHIAEDTASNVDSHLAEDTVSNVDSEPEPWIKGPQDRDSGIELPVDGG